MRAITFIRALHWVAVVVSGWAMSSRWGDELAVGKGPPSQWERHLVGATLLVFIAALSMSLTARSKRPALSGRPGTLALGISALCGAGSLGLALWLRSTAMARGLGHVLLGGGWNWMLGGAALALAATGGALVLRLQSKSGPGKSKG